MILIKLLLGVICRALVLVTRVQGLNRVQNGEC